MFRFKRAQRPACGTSGTAPLGVGPSCEHGVAVAGTHALLFAPFGSTAANGPALAAGGEGGPTPKLTLDGGRLPRPRGAREILGHVAAIASPLAHQNARSVNGHSFLNPLGRPSHGVGGAQNCAPNRLRLLGSSPVENDPNRLGQQYRPTKVRLVCKRRAVGLGANTNGTNTFVLMDAPVLNRIAVRGKMCAFSGWSCRPSGG